MQISRLYMLDGARGIAAFCILLFHVAPGEFSNFYIAVDFFFVLSGFVLATSVSRISSLLSARKFLLSRFLRIFPMALAVYLYTAFYDLLLILKHWTLNEPQSPVIILSAPTLVFSFLMLQVFYEPAMLVDWPIWSLSAEWIANIFVSLVCIFTRKAKYIALLIGACLIGASSLFDSSTANQIGRALWGFSVGLIAFGFSERLLNYRKVTLAIFLSILPISFFLQNLGEIASLVTVWPFTAGIIFLSQVKTVPRLSRFCSQLGEFSYGFYLWHFPMLALVGFLIRTIGINETTLFGTLFLIVIGSILSIIATKISLVFLEQPIRRRWIKTL